MNDARAGGASSFVDRLVVKAFGGADVAAARMPSTYEPLRAHGGAMPDASRGDRIDDEMFGDDLMHGDRDPREAYDRWRQSRSETPRTAAATSPSDVSVAVDGHHEIAARARHARTAHGDAADGRGAGSPAAHGIDEDEDDGAPAGALVPAAASDARGSRRGDHSADNDASARIARSTLDVATPSDSGTSRRASNATVAPDAARMVQPSARPRASLDGAPFTPDIGNEDGVGRRPTREPARDGVLMPIANDVARHLANDRAGWREREPASRGARGDGDGTTSEVTVNVTIGRVDVRAVQAPAAAVRPARTGGVRPVALDEYLAQRGGAR